MDWYIFSNPNVKFYYIPGWMLIKCKTKKFLLSLILQGDYCLFLPSKLSKPKCKINKFTKRSSLYLAHYPSPNLRKKPHAYLKTEFPK